MKNTRLFMFAACTLFLAACGRQTVKIMTPPDASNRVLFGAEQLQTTLDKAGYQVMMQQERRFSYFDDGQSDQSVRQGWEWCHLRMP